MKLEALIFDVDGTLADTEEAHRQAFNAAFVECGLWWNWSRHRYGELLDVAGGKERLAAHIECLDLAPAERAALLERVPEIHAAKTRLYGALVASGRVRLRSGVGRLLREARTRGARLAIATTTTAANVWALLDATLGAGARSWFDAVACGDEVPAKKPAPDIYHRALDALALPAAACVAFEDSAKGLAAARGAGLCTVVTPTFWTADEDFSGADLVLPDLGDPAAPLHAAVAARIGAPFLGLRELETLHAAAAAHGQSVPARIT